MFHRPLDVPDPFPSFCSTALPSTLTALLVTGIRKPPCDTPPGGLLFVHLAESTPPPGYEPKTCSDVSTEHTPINYSSMRNSFNIENDLITTVMVFQQQAAASGSPQQASSGVVIPWLSADVWSSTRKLVRCNESISSVEGALSRGKRDRKVKSPCLP